LVVEFELVDEHAGQVAPLFFAKRGVKCNALTAASSAVLSLGCSFLAVRAKEGVTITTKGMV
jgi:hypothetical protein